jgi:hypothetical protein
VRRADFPECSRLSARRLRAFSNNVALTPELATIIGEEFGSRADGENAFDGVNGAAA